MSDPHFEVYYQLQYQDKLLWNWKPVEEEKEIKDVSEAMRVLKCNEEWYPETKHRLVKITVTTDLGG